MTTPILYPLVNGVRHSWASIEVKVANLILYATAVSYTRKRNRTMVRVNHPDPVAKTRGSNEYTGELEMLLAEYNLLQAALIATSFAPTVLLGPSPTLTLPGGFGGYGDVFFQVLVSYSENGLDTITDSLLGCTMDSTDASNSEGTEPTKRKFELNPLKVLFNGAEDLGQPLRAPPGG